MLNMVPPLIMNILTDLMIMAIPAPVLIRVKTTVWKRLGLLALFGGGFFVMIAAILRVSMVLIVSCLATPLIWGHSLTICRRKTDPQQLSGPAERISLLL